MHREFFDGSHFMESLNPGKCRGMRKECWIKYFFLLLWIMSKNQGKRYRQVVQASKEKGQK